MNTYEQPASNSNKEIGLVAKSIMDLHGREISDYASRLGEKTPEATNKLSDFIKKILDGAGLTTGNPRREFVLGFLTQIYEPRDLKKKAMAGRSEGDESHLNTKRLMKDAYSHGKAIESGLPNGDK